VDARERARAWPAVTILDVAAVRPPDPEPQST